MIWQYRNRYAPDADTNGIHVRLICLNGAHVAAANTGINLTGGNLRNKAGPVPEHQAGKGATMSSPSHPHTSIPPNDYGSAIATPEFLDIMLDDMGLDSMELRHAVKRWCIDILDAFADEIPFNQLKYEAGIFVDGYDACQKEHNIQVG